MSETNNTKTNQITANDLKELNEGFTNPPKIVKMPSPAVRYQVQRAYWEKRLGAKFDAKKFNQDFATGLARQDY